MNTGQSISAAEILARSINERVHGLRCAKVKDIAHTCNCGVADGWIYEYEARTPEHTPVLVKYDGDPGVPQRQWKPALNSNTALIESLRSALAFHDRANAAPNGFETGAINDARDWVLTAAREVAK